MFGWLRRWRMRRAREIFVYWDGLRWRYADPIRLDKKLVEICPEWKDAVSVLFSKLDQLPLEIAPIEQRQIALKRKQSAVELLTKKSVELFDLKELDDNGHGLTQDKCLMVLADFVAFANELVEEARPFPNSLEFAGPSPAESATGPLPDVILPETTSEPDSPKLSVQA